jgi:hypothetical protein
MLEEERLYEYDNGTVVGTISHQDAKALRNDSRK